MIAKPMMKSMPLVASLAEVAWTEAASAKITAKKNRSAAAMPPRIGKILITSCM